MQVSSECRGQGIGRRLLFMTAIKICNLIAGLKLNQPAQIFGFGVPKRHRILINCWIYCIIFVRISWDDSSYHMMKFGSGE